MYIILLSFALCVCAFHCIGITKTDVDRIAYMDLESALWKHIERAETPDGETKGLVRVFAQHHVFTEHRLKPLKPAGAGEAYFVLNGVYEWKKIEKELCLLNQLFNMYRMLLNQYSSMPANFDKTQLIDLASTVLHKYRGPFKRASTLETIEEKMVRQCLTARAKLEDLHQDCSMRQSAQQMLYELYAIFSLNQLRGYVIMQFSWMLLAAYGKGNHSDHSNNLLFEFVNHATNTQHILRNATKNAERHVWRCDPPEHVEDVTYVTIQPPGYFSLREAVSDVRTNHVVTGLRFRKVNWIVHLQIQEGPLLARGAINASAVHWRPLSAFHLTAEGVKPAVDYLQVSNELGAIDMDDVLAIWPQHVVTGVRLRTVGEHLQLEIRETEMNFESGELFGPSTWHKKYNRSEESEKLRTKRNSVPTTSTRQYVKFTQITAPFFDIQDVVTVPPVALGGVGLYHKGQAGFVDFVAPKLFTYDFSEYIDYSEYRGYPGHTQPMFPPVQANNFFEPAFGTTEANLMSL